MSASPARTFASPLFPHPPRFLPMRVAGQPVELSYVDVGPRDAEPVVLLHGNPTWSFLWREVIPPLARRHRVIAPDLLGFGRSDRLRRMADYTLENHLAALAALLDHLRLERVTLAVHDWGGPIGLSWAVDHPERLARLVIMNTWAFAPRAHNRVPQPLKTFRTPALGEALVLRLNAFVEVALPGGVRRKLRFYREAMGAYRAPFPDAASRKAVLAFPRHIPLDGGDAAYARMKRTDEGLRKLKQPVLLVWGARDPVFPPRVMEKFRERLVGVREDLTLVLEDASHFLQEDHGREIGLRIAAFTAQT
ncbi:MAG TPA: alpha/beta fold hydrolase [Polyangiaceae bacterium LLY-WYZ-15_(1-7)]|nr:alpha/beta hydrolase [Myxococcales bacterium]MAT28602.1 alpha/beta hydrolase [Sandaracinus sp.]HJL01647.1 alpha/beta fold hydrolase [Polyangiaceae bacterium LLY-WYZ-15_(1-7)]MBJ71969.1 alpha/beta hydrolase [Sandaracinus sp.]HJL08687.1 alpha/beta fold hydrolase [Polyangiaceae bacterium LLY-WYZ-15_(1-7)]